MARKFYTQKCRENNQEENPEPEIDQIRKDIEMKGDNWKEIQENRKWENRDGWRFVCNKRPYFWKQLKNDED